MLFVNQINPQIIWFVVTEMPDDVVDEQTETSAIPVIGAEKGYFFLYIKTKFIRLVRNARICPKG